MSRTDDLTRCYCQRDKLALRMIQNGARISTVATWTGLSSSRISTLVQQNASVPPVRHSGQPARGVAYFFRNPVVAMHAATLASIFYLFEIQSYVEVGTLTQGYRPLETAEKLCDAYEMYVAMVQSPLIRFEHAALLATELAEGRQIFLRFCERCGRATLVDWSAFGTDACTHCRPAERLPATTGSDGLN